VSAAGRKADFALAVSCAFFLAGVFVFLAGRDYHSSVLQLVGALVAGGGTGSIAFCTVVAWAAWLDAGGGCFCLVFQLGHGRVRHLHWPRRDIVKCERSAGLHIGRKR
jgi:hypothetical protein